MLSLTMYSKCRESAEMLHKRRIYLHWHAFGIESKLKVVNLRTR